MKAQIIFASLAFALTGAFTAPVASADCNISANDCFENGKCNIKFRNLTGDAGGQSSGTKLTQISGPQIIRVKAAKDNGKAAGNVLNIGASANKTMNIGKKWRKGFAKIRISAPTMAATQGVTMSCADVNKVLAGNGTCKVFNGMRKNASGNVVFQLGYRCDVGRVYGPAK